MTDNAVLETIRQSIIGDGAVINTPFGSRPLIYADYTASGRSLSFIEDILRQEVLPFYANTHTETSFTGAQSTALREQARALIRRATHCSADDRVIFCGSGATAAIDKLITILNLRIPRDLDNRYQLSSHIPDEERPIVLVGPYEHHSNELPWRETVARVIRIPLDDRGAIDQEVLEAQLIEWAGRRVIGSFSAASNVTGVKSDVSGITRLLHCYGAVACWDYAAAGPYVEINMTGDEPSAAPDAVFVSPHKFIGGPDTPGILLVKRSLLSNSVPSVPGGGTVSYVTAERHRYLCNEERREEGGTPAIIGAIRAGLVFELKERVGVPFIEQRERQLLARLITAWRPLDTLHILGPQDSERLSIVSFRVTHGGRDLHYGFVVALLNDLFGIQARGGCSCAGPYGHELLGIDNPTSRRLERIIREGITILRPGWVRLNLNYFIDDATAEYIIEAVALIAQYGWRLLPYYHYDKEHAVWRFQQQPMQLPTCLVRAMCARLEMGGAESGDGSQGAINSPESSSVCAVNETQLSDYLEQGKAILTGPLSHFEPQYLSLPDEANALRWFVCPQDIAVTDTVAEGVASAR
jgi:selenocysteine lyase/cysteine desulfurase